ncbi:hypothetical protein ACX9R5_00875 [Rathayibacter sp. CAU 1779]
MSKIPHVYKDSRNIDSRLRSFGAAPSFGRRRAIMELRRLVHLGGLGGATSMMASFFSILVAMIVLGATTVTFVSAQVERAVPNEVNEVARSSGNVMTFLLWSAFVLLLLAGYGAIMQALVERRSAAAAMYLPEYERIDAELRGDQRATRRRRRRFQ